VRPVPAVETGEGERLRSGGGASGHGCVRAFLRFPDFDGFFIYFLNKSIFYLHFYCLFEAGKRRGPGRG
jgi:hypothetical protein